MLPLILFIVLIVVVLVLVEFNERRKKTKEARAESRESRAESREPKGRPEGCCGEHLVCEKETLLQTNAKIEYYDDEELDALAGIAPEQYTEAQQEAIRAVFNTLRENDVPGWCRSMQLRNIALPADIREEALMIVKELRAKS